MQWKGVRASLRAGVAPRVCGRVGNGRGREARQGAIRVFWGDTYPAIHVPSLAPTSCRKRTGAGLHEHPMRDLAKPGAREKTGGVPAEVHARGWLAGSRIG